MADRILLTDKAEGDIAVVLAWFRDQQATAAGSRWLEGLQDKIDTLSTKAATCSIAFESAEIGPEIRELIYGKGKFKHRILFHIVVKTVYLLRVWHSSRDSISRDDLGL